MQANVFPAGEPRAFGSPCARRVVYRSWQSTSTNQYDDRTGLSYEYPSGRYESWIRTGEQFLYQFRGQHYGGAGVIGEIEAGSRPGLLVCRILDHREFPSTVPLRRPDGQYWEAEPETGRVNVYWAQGVRPVKQSTFDAITAVGLGPELSADGDTSTQGYASSETAIAVEAYAMRAAMKWARSRFEGENVQPMPHKNPGFDILVGDPNSVLRYVEVKGTQAADPWFFMSEGERKFSGSHAESYTLVVITGINLREETHDGIVSCDGDVQTHTEQLLPTQWRGLLSVSFSCN